MLKANAVMSNNTATWEVYFFRLGTMGSPGQDYGGWLLGGVIGDPLLQVRRQQARLRKGSWRKESRLLAGQNSSEHIPDTRKQLDLGGALKLMFWESQTLTPKENRAPSNPAPPCQRHRAAEACNQLCHSFQSQEQTQSDSPTPKKWNKSSLRNNSLSHQRSPIVFNLTKNEKCSNMGFYIKKLIPPKSIHD